MIACQINNQSLVTIYDEVVADSVKYLMANFTFSDDWEGYSKTVIFNNYSNNKILTVTLIDGDSLYLGDNTCYIPHEVIESPGFSISVFGVKDESVITTNEKNIVVKESGYKRGETPEEPTPTDVERIIGIATSAKNVAESVRADADAGLFKGDKGDKGDTGPQGPKGDPGEATVDQTYDGSSTNAQSGTAVAGAICGIDFNYFVKLSMTDGVGPVWTDAEKNGSWKRQSIVKVIGQTATPATPTTPEIITVMDQVAVPGAKYFLGEQSTVSFTLPDTAIAGQEIMVSWYNGSNPATVLITVGANALMLDYSYIPAANTRSELNCLWDGSYWSVLGIEQGVPENNE